MAMTIGNIISAWARRGEHERQAIAHFRKLHERNIEVFQRRLTAVAEDLQGKEIKDDAAHDALHELLHRYTEAIADLESMNVRPAVSKSEHGPNADDAEAARSTKPKPSHSELVSMLCPKAPKTFANRFRAAIRGFAINTVFQVFVAYLVGAAILTPMIIMVLDPAQMTALITTIVSVSIFATSLVPSTPWLTLPARGWNVLGSARIC